MESLDALRELNYADHDPQFAPDPDEYIPEKEERYINALYDLYSMIEECESTVYSISQEYRTRKLKGIETMLENINEDIDKLISKGL